MMGVADMPIQTLKLLNIHPDAKAGKKGRRQRRQLTMHHPVENQATAPSDQHRAE
jgi:hypothetical protein